MFTNNLINALQILLKYQKSDTCHYTGCEKSIFIVYIDDINDVTNEDFKQLFKLGFFAGLDSDCPDNEVDSEIHQQHLGGLSDNISDDDIIYLKEHCSNAFSSFEHGSGS